MYNVVKNMKPVRDIYREQCVSQYGVDAAELDKIDAYTKNELEQAYVKSKTLVYEREDWATESWEAIKDTSAYGGDLKNTGEKIDYLRKLGVKLSTLPEDQGKFHPQIVKIFKQRLAAMESGQGIDWGTAEALAFATLIDEGYHVRISGQDVERGTFSHRHAHVFFQDRDGHYDPINTAVGGRDSSRNFIASNSHLSEYAVLGYEYGYAGANPNSLTLWEAQFGDFANGAQIMIDQFIAAGEAKWNTANGLVMLLPHGYDGNGPEHSSCRVERYLQLSDSVDSPELAGKDSITVYQECNMGIVNCSTAAQYFHVLRRQMRRPFRKPLVVVAPKKLLKFAAAGSAIEDFADGETFKRVIPETSTELVAPEKIRRMVFCSG